MLFFLGAFFLFFCFRRFTLSFYLSCHCCYCCSLFCRRTDGSVCSNERARDLLSQPAFSFSLFSSSLSPSSFFSSFSSSLFLSPSSSYRSSNFECSACNGRKCLQQRESKRSVVNRTEFNKLKREKKPHTANIESMKEKEGRGRKDEERKKKRKSLKQRKSDDSVIDRKRTVSCERRGKEGWKT